MTDICLIPGPDRFREAPLDAIAQALATVAGDELEGIRVALQDGLAEFEDPEVVESLNAQIREQLAGPGFRLSPVRVGELLDSPRRAHDRVSVIRLAAVVRLLHANGLGGALR